MSFDKKFKELRKSRNLKQGEIAEILDTDRSTITKWETGKSKPTADMLISISDYFEVSIDILLDTPAARAATAARLECYANALNSSENKISPSDDGLSDNKKALITFAETVPEDKAALILQVMKSIVEAD